MPELPEVETVVRVLESQIKDREIVHTDIFYEKTVECNPALFIKSLENQHFRSFARRGKYLLFYMDDVILTVHLRMEGKFYIQKPDIERSRHVHVVFSLDDGTELRYHDTRKFGRMNILPYDTDFTHYKNLGPEPFWDSFTDEYVYDVCRYRNVPLKSLLLDQHFAAGIGNIYADEILAVCNLRPGRNCRRISHNDAENIVIQTQRILREAIAAGGTTIRSYTSSLGVTGMFQTDCTVHMQKICKRCGGNIRMKYIGGRSSYYCPVCQK